MNAQITTTPKPRINPLYFIFATLLIDCIGIGIIIPVIPSLIKQLAGVDTSGASKYGGYLFFTYALFQFIAAPILGNLSDRFGRRPLILATLIGFGLDYLLVAFAPNIFWLFIGRMVAGITGGSYSIGMSYIADVTSPEKRAQNFGLVGAAFGLGFILGPLLGGLMASLGLRAPFFLAAALGLTNAILCYFFLPESLSAENRRPFEWKKANPIGSLVEINKFKSIQPLIIVFFMYFIAGQTMPAIWSYFCIERFNWNETQIGYSLAVVGLCVGAVQGGLIRIVVPKIGQANAVIYGMLLNILSYFLYGFATEAWMIYVLIAPFALSGLAGPTIQGIVSSRVPANQQGQLQGALTALISLSSIIGPIIQSNLFSYFTGSNSSVYMPGISFFVAGAMNLIGLLIFLSSRKIIFQKEFTQEIPADNSSANAHI